MSEKVRSLRMSDDLWARVVAEAARLGVSSGAFIVGAVERQLRSGDEFDDGSAPEPPRPGPSATARAKGATRKAPPLVKREATEDPHRILEQAEAGAAHLAAPGRREGRASVRDIEGLAVGPVRPALGSRLKGGTRLNGPAASRLRR